MTKDTAKPSKPECNCKSNASPMWHGRNCPILKTWKETEAKR